MTYPPPLKPSPEDYARWDRQHVWHPFTPMWEYEREETPVIVGGEGFELIDARGRRYLDGTSALWCNVHGYGVPELNQALHQQVDRLSHSTLLGLANAPSAELAYELAQRAPEGLSHVFYSDDGSTAVEAALKLVFQAHIHRGADPRQKNMFVRLGQSYHGDTLGAVSVGGIDGFHHFFGPLLFPTLEVPCPAILPVKGQASSEEHAAWALQRLEQTLRENQHRIAGFVIEPLIQGAAGMLVHPPGYLRRVRELTAELGIPLIADEVFVAFGRTGTLFSCEHERVIPDVLCLSKGLTGGYMPLACTLVNEEFYQAFYAEPAVGKTFYHGHTFTGNPLGCAVALASLRRIETDNVLRQALEVEKTLQQAKRIYVDHPQIADVRQRGCVLALDLRLDRETGQPFPAERRIGHRIALAARERGVILRPIGDVVILVPAPAMPVSLVERLVTETHAALRSVLGV